MEATVAFSYLTNLISVMGSIFTTPFIFGISILQIIIIVSISNVLLGILLGGVEERIKNPSDKAYSSTSPHLMTYEHDGKTDTLWI